MSRKMTTEEFIAKATKVHNGLYGYDRVEYVSRYEPVWIYCKSHGYFQQKPINHLNKRGCQKCAEERKKNRLVPPPLTQEQFIQKAQDVHGDLYDYSLVKFKGVRRYVTLVCEKHGEFQQKAVSHLNGCGCPSCYEERRGKHQQLDTDTYIQKAKEKHGEFFDYSKTVYTHTKAKIIVTCPVHSDFEVRADQHIGKSGNGCPKCGIERKSYGIQGFYGTMEPSNLYLIEMADSQDAWIKIGLSRNPEVRRNEFLRNVPDIKSVEFLQLWSGPARTLYEDAERPTVYHSPFDKFHKDGWGWQGRTECFPYEVKDELFDKTEELMQSLQGVERIL